jgi:hypothetical protein
MDEFTAFRNKKSGVVSQPAVPTQTAKTGNTVKPMQPNVRVLDSIFEKNGQMDFDAINQHSKTFGGYQYQSATLPKQQPQQVALPNHAPVDHVAQIKAEVDKYSKELSDTRLAPIERAYAKLVQRYGGEGNVPQEVLASLNEEYLEQKNQIRDLADAKKDELRDKQFKEQLESKDYQTLELKSKENFSGVAKDFFPNASPDKQPQILEELIFGYQANGKYVPGYGADMINHLFDLQNKGKVFNTSDEWAKAYNKFWVDYSSNPNNIKALAKIAFNNYHAANESKRRDAYRSQWEKEQQEKLKMSTNQKPTSSKIGGLGSQDSVAQQMRDFVRPPSRNL